MPNSSDNIILVGFMGAGKTTIGKALSKKMDHSFIDSDVEIEKLEGASISEIFKTKGEKYFRMLESNFIKEFQHSNCVIATGGGMPCFNHNMVSLKTLGNTFYLKVNTVLLLDRIEKDFENRPMAKDKQGFDEVSLLSLFKSREEFYKMAHHEIDGDISVEDIVLNLLTKFKYNGG